MTIGAIPHAQEMLPAGGKDADRSLSSKELRTQIAR
jgi:hypothetical protein